MPAAPVFRNVFGKIRPVEVLLYANSKHLRDPDGDIDSARKIRVQLNRIQRHSKQRICACIHGRISDEHADRRKQPVRNDKLFEISP